MGIQPYIPNNDKIETTLVVNNNDEALHTLLKQVDVKFELNKIPTAIFTLVQASANSGAQKIFDKLKPNDNIEFSCGNQKSPPILFKGFIKNIDKINNNAVKLQCKDHAFRLTEITDEAVNEADIQNKIDSILKNKQLTNNIAIGHWGKEIVTQTSNKSNWDYLISFLDSIGEMVVVKNGEFTTLSINKKLSELPEETYIAEQGINIHDINANKNVNNQIENIKIYTTFTGSNETVEIDSSLTFPNDLKKEAPPIRLSQTSLSEETLSLMANAMVAKSYHAVIQGTLNTIGNTTANLGDFLKISRYDKAIDDQKYIISGEQHSLENGCWKTIYSFGLESSNNFAQKVAPDSPTTSNETRLGINNTINGIHIGKITQLEDDPKKLFRIKVNIPTISNKGDGLWARLSSLQAGNKRGGFFIPDVGDEVIVGFFNNSADNPVILGKLYNTDNPPPFPITKGNEIQGIVSKEGTKIIIDDKNKAIELSTKTGHTLLISDAEKGFVMKDANGNKIVMNADGITLESASNFTIKAKGKINMQSMQSILKADTQMELKGKLIKLN